MSTTETNEHQEQNVELEAKVKSAVTQNLAQNDGAAADSKLGAIRHLPSEMFDAAADGLEAADMLLSNYPKTSTPNLDRKSTGPDVEPPALTSPPEDKSKKTSTIGSELAKENHETVETLPAQTADGAPINELPQFVTASNVGSEAEDPRLLSQPSQVWNYFAEGIDAADARFEAVPERDELLEQEQVEEQQERVARQQSDPKEKVEAPANTSEPNNTLEESVPGQVLGTAGDQRRRVSKYSSSVPPTEGSTARDSDDDDDDDEATGRRTGHPLAPRNWLNFLKDFSYETDSKKGKLILRDRAFRQTSNKMNVSCMVDKGDSASEWGYRLLLTLDWFDTFLTYGTAYILMILVLIYTAHLLVFAGFYYAIAQNCDSSQSMTYAQAFAFSLETATTTGYTLPQANDAMFFGGCDSWVVVIYLQCIYDLIFNGIVVGTLMLRYARADRRSNQIIFSDKACIACIRGRFYLSFQCFDLQANRPIIGASVRTFAILHEVSQEARALWQMRSMRLVRPDDETGSKLWLSIPCICLHEIDAWSPLAPSVIARPPKIVHSTAANRFPQPPQRAADGRVGSRAQTTCAVCGNAFITEAALRRHMIYAQNDELAKGRPETFGHRKVDVRNLTRQVITRLTTFEQGSTGREEANQSSSSQDANLPFRTVAPNVVRDAIRDRIIQRNIEIVCIIEGTDPHTAKTFQARHSYGADDIAYDAQHTPCMGVGKDGSAEVNLSYFHQVDHHDTVNVEEPMAFASHT